MTTKLSPKSEPAVWIGAALAAAAAVLTHVLHLTPGQWKNLLAAVPVVVGVLTRFNVRPNAPLAELATDALTEAERDAAEAAQRLADLHAAVAPAVLGTGYIAVPPSSLPDVATPSLPPMVAGFSPVDVPIDPVQVRLDALEGDVATVKQRMGGF